MAGQGLGLCSRSQTLSVARPLAGMASGLLGSARVPVGLAILEPPAEERDLGCFLGGEGGRWGTPYQPGPWRAGLSGLEEKRTKEKGFNRV